MSQVPLKTVSQLTRELKELVESNFPEAWVVGEISNCTRAGSGHVYLTLKDDAAQLRAVIWRSTAERLKFELHDGLEVVAAGPVEIYAARGTYQLIIRQLIPQGIGALELAFRQMQQKLAAEGLFDPEHKRPLPAFPRRIALVTSPTGAAVRDILQVITRRWQAADIVVVPTAVQGEGAAEQIAAALQAAAKLPDVDVIITGRGGGSLEDLWAFNEEIVARAIFACPIPVISAVGHEIDVSIADLVADRRALTPSEAGELAVPQRAEVWNELRRFRERMIAALRSRAGQARMQLDHLASRRVMMRPFDRLHELAAELDHHELRLRRAMAQRIRSARQATAALAGSMDALSPLKVVQRGYSITRKVGDKTVVRSAADLQVGDELETILSAGLAKSRVEAVIETESALAALQSKAGNETN